MRKLSALDSAILGADRLLRAAGGARPATQRDYPAETMPEAPGLSSEDRRHVAGLMRVNHAGEVCAQALYLGQAALARQPETREALWRAADEEADHLHWCKERLAELDAHPSRLDPAWFAGALAIGAGAALVSDGLSLGFVEETEHQVVEHLDGHLRRLPNSDQRTRAIIETMRADEARHARTAHGRGARPLPFIVRVLMRLQAKVMTTIAYRI